MNCELPFLFSVKCEMLFREARSLEVTIQEMRIEYLILRDM